MNTGTSKGSASPGTADAGPGTGGTDVSRADARVRTGDAGTSLVDVTDLSVDFGGPRAVDGLSFGLARGAALALVGESGSGKSTVASALLGLHRGTGARVDGRVEVAGVDVQRASDDELRRLRGARAAMVFQDPLSSLDPYYAVGDQIAEVYRVHTRASRRAARARAVEVLDRVGIPDAGRRSRSRPHEFSGGMRQRALIAMALACEPDLLIADEPTTALDVTVQAQILDLLHGLREETGMGLLLVTHDVGVAAESADEILVMRHGRAVERGPVARVLGDPAEPYTRELLGAVPRVEAPRADTRVGAQDVRTDARVGARDVRTDARVGARDVRTDTRVGARDVRTDTRVGARDVTSATSTSGVTGTQDVPSASDVRGMPGVPDEEAGARRAAAPRAEVSGTDTGTGRREPSREAVVRPVAAGSVPGPATGTAHAAAAGPGPGADGTPRAAQGETVLEAVGLRREFGRGKRAFAAVDDVSLTVHRGETLGIVGESGSGKTTLGRMLVGLLEPTAGQILPGGGVRPDVQMVFQDPVSSLNPRRSVGESIADPLRARGTGVPLLGRRQERASAEARIRGRVHELLERVGLQGAHYDRYPHEFSGGQRQRVGIARALAADPRVIVCDEPVSALDVTTQAQVIALLDELRRELGLALVFVAHDLAVVRQVSDRVAVMRRGRIVEHGRVDEVYESPRDPYTRQLLAAVPALDPAVAAARRATRRAARRHLATV